MKKAVGELQTQNINLEKQLSTLRKEKDILNTEFIERGLTTEQIADKAQSFYTNSFNWLLAIVAVSITIGAGIIPLIQYLRIRADSRKIDEAVKESKSINEKLLTEFSDINCNLSTAFWELNLATKKRDTSLLFLIYSTYFASKSRDFAILDENVGLLDDVQSSIRVLKFAQGDTMDCCEYDALGEIKKLLITQYSGKCQNKRISKFYHNCLDIIDARLQELNSGKNEQDECSEH